ncbi:MAG: hypothetical protein L0Y57_00535 [Beijerinckiaceae bacterium]|nr:hypothetical protein [Beijerinckiaceae bacterium]
MTTRVTFETAQTLEPAAPGCKALKARVLFLALLVCLSWLHFSSAAEAAPFQQYKNGVCTTGPICTIDFAVVPSGKRLEITNASCYLRASVDLQLHAMQFLVLEGTAIRSALTLLPKFVDDISLSVPVQTVYSANHSIFAFANAGQRFQAYVELKHGTYSQFACHISGQLRP